MEYVKPIIIWTLYRPSDSLVELFDPIEKLVSNIDQEIRECIVAGDFNCNLLKTEDNNSKLIKRIYRAYSFKQLIETPTRTARVTQKHSLTMWQLTDLNGSLKVESFHAASVTTISSN